MFYIATCIEPSYIMRYTNELYYYYYYYYYYYNAMLVFTFK